MITLPAACPASTAGSKIVAGDCWARTNGHDEDDYPVTCRKAVDPDDDLGLCDKHKALYRERP